MKFDIKTFSKNLLKNKLVLNIVAFLALLNLFGLIITGNIESTVFFIVLALLVRHFSKNMIVVLGVPIVVVNLFSLNKYKEGMKLNKHDEKNETEEDEKNETEEDEKNEKNEKNSKEEESFEVGRAKNKGTKIDYAATIEDAYDDLNNILGSDGIKRLTDDTQHLMKQQANLAKSMEAMTPLIQNILPMAEQAKEMMKSMDGGSDGLASIMKMAEQMSGGLNKNKSETESKTSTNASTNTSNTTNASD